MEEILKIQGGNKLEGKVRIGGSKNATVALIPAAILANELVSITGIPKISDVGALMILLKELKCETEMVDEDSLTINPKNMVNNPLEHDSVTKLRASYYFMGALLGKYREVNIRMSGGCDLGPRPINLHLKGFEALGAKVEQDSGYYHIWAKELKGTDIFLDIASVGATINIMMAAVYAQGRTRIENAAKEPEIIDVANLLNKMGALVKGAGTNTIIIDGVDYLGGCSHEIIPDRIEAGTYIIMAAAAAKDVLIENVIPGHLEALMAKLKEIEIPIESGIDWVHVKEAANIGTTNIMTLPYPGLATDLQQPFSVLLTQGRGCSTIEDTIYQERFRHCPQLRKMGADIAVDKGICVINGPTKLKGSEVMATDLRGGAALVIAALIAQGETTIREIYHIDRGYEAIDEKLGILGADIKRTIE